MSWFSWFRMVLGLPFDILTCLVILMPILFRVCRDEWIPTVRNPLVGSQLSVGLPEFRVADLFDQQHRMWRDPLLAVLFQKETSWAIRSIYFSLQDMDDELVWEGTRNGIFSVKSAYLLGFEESNSKGFLDKSRIDFKVGVGSGVWVPPKLLHCILAVKDALLRTKISVDPICPLCGQES